MNRRPGWSSSTRTMRCHAVCLMLATSGCSALSSLDDYHPCSDCPAYEGGSAFAEGGTGGADGNEGIGDSSADRPGSDGPSGASDGSGTGDARAPDGGDSGSAGSEAGDASFASGDASDAGTLGLGLLAYYRFDETSGTTAADSSGNGQTASLSGGATFSAGIQGNAVTLNGTSQYVSVPSGLLSNAASFSVSAWVKLTSSPTWCRLFDFGSGTTAYMFLSPNSGSATTRFAITSAGLGQEQQVNTTSPLPTGSWEHVVVTLSGSTATLYLQGVSVAQNTSMTLTPTSLGSTPQTWIGRSQYGSDPYLNGQIDNFRVYGRALTPSEVRELYSARL